MTQWADQFTGLQTASGSSVAVIGAGIGGLTTAYLLAKRGFQVTVFEAAERVGGRIYTDYNTFNPMFSEKGGEWIDSTHHQIIDMAHELGLDVQDVTKKRTGEDLYYFEGKHYRPIDFMDPATGTGAYAALAEYIARDDDKSKRDPTHAEIIDAMSIKDYLARAQSATRTPDWVIDSIKMAYQGEFGTEVENQSALLLVRQIGTSKRSQFEVYGEKQDESRRIKGGNAKLVDALKSRLDAMGVTIHTKYPLKKIEYVSAASHPVYLTFDNGNVPRRMGFDYAVAAIPFSKLRDVEGLDELRNKGQLSDEKLKAIREIPYGNIVKITLGMKGLPWKKANHFPGDANGSFRSDLPYLQNTWITSVSQKDERERSKEQEKLSLITILVAGEEATHPLPAIIKGCKQSLSQLFDSPEEQLFTDRVSFHDWKKHQFSKGSYSYFAPGQFTTLRAISGTPEVEGRLGFAGEHTDPELYGYMNGAVHSALVEAKRIENHTRKLVPGAHSARADIPAKPFGVA